MKSLSCVRFSQACLLVHLVLAILTVGIQSAFSQEQKRPNILLIVADDLGFSDLGCFGSEIQTPHLDRLAKNGLRLSQFYTTGRCCPSRASILTGHYPHRVGLGHMTKDIGLRGYRGKLSREFQTLAQMLNPSGYRSFLSGKWHLGTHDPTKHGFEEFYGTLVSAKTFWDSDHFIRLTRGGKGNVTKRALKAKNTHRPFHGTDALAEQAIEFLEKANRTPQRPWFLYLAFNAPHFPLHAPKELIARYAERYQGGWDKLRLDRLARMKKLGIVPNDTRLSPRSPFYDWAASKGDDNPEWKKLGEDRRKDLARRMAIYAAMVDQMDQNIGRVISRLEERKELDNTIVVFTSDNGACAEWDPMGFDRRSGPTNILHRGKRIDQMGMPGTFHCAGSGWANASNTPWRLYKHFNHEGGIAAPCIIHWPHERFTRSAGTIDNTPTHLIDLVPTLLDASGVSTDRRTPELPGKSLLPLLEAGRIQSRQLFFEHEGNRAVRDGNWKLVALRNSPWELYEFGSDRIESNNVASKYPDKVRRLSTAWSKWAKANDVTPLPDDYQVEYLSPGQGINDRKRIPVELVSDERNVQKLAGGFRFTEGPAWDGEGAWYFSDLPNRTLHRWTRSRGVELIRTGKKGFSNGIVFDNEKRLVFCDVTRRCIVRRSSNGQEETIADSCDGRSIGMPNDLWCAPDGSIYFTIPLTSKKRAKAVPPEAVNGTVCRISPGGNSVQDVGIGIKSPNGIVGTSDGKWLFVADPGSRKCWRFSITSKGSLTRRTKMTDRASDGLAVDNRGNLYVTGQDGVEVFSANGEYVGTIPVPEKPANMKFGGKENRTLFITARTSIYSVEMKVRGN